MGVDYSNGKIYGIYEDDRLLYIGSTTQTLSKRMAKHRTNSKTEHSRNFPIYRYVAERGGWDGIYIELLETCPCSNVEELIKREGELIRQNKTPFNKRIEGRTPKEWRDDYYMRNRETIVEKQRLYYLANKEKILERQRLKRLACA